MDPIVVGEPNILPHIDGVYAFLSKDKEGNEGLCGFQYKTGHWMPMVAADEKRMKSLIPVAEQIAANSDQDVILVKFSNREELRRFVAKKKGKADGTPKS